MSQRDPASLGNLGDPHLVRRIGREVRGMLFNKNPCGPEGGREALAKVAIGEEQLGSGGSLVKHRLLDLRWFEVVIGRQLLNRFARVDPLRDDAGGHGLAHHNRPAKRQAGVDGDGPFALSHITPNKWV